MIKLINGVQRNLGLMDFCVDKLSSRLVIMAYDGFSISKKKVRDINGEEVETTVFGVNCTNTFNNKQVKIDVAYTTENKVILEEAERRKKTNLLQKVAVDFEDCVVGHYCSSNGNFANVAQTYKAERIKILNNDEVQAILKKTEDENTVSSVIDQIRQEKQQQHK